MVIAARRVFAIAAVALMAATATISSAHAQDFLSALFGAFTGRQAPPPPPQSSRQPSRHVAMPFASERASDDGSVQRRYAPSQSGQAYCVRTCDGRYFPLSAADGQSRAASCNSFCPAAETKVFYGSTIDSASAENGKQYSDLPNAFKYRKELVAGCTCNGKDQIGLAPVKIETDPTLRRGDIVAGADGLMVNRGVDRRGASLNLSPASTSIRAKYERVPVVASE